MNTPTHVLVNLVLLRRQAGLCGRGQRDDTASLDPRGNAAAVLCGALLPDLPMFGFWAIQTFALTRSQHAIWSVAYFDPGWQRVFDAFNSIPIFAALAIAAWWASRRALLASSLSALLHMALDLPFHREDAHAHFWPLADWHFVSPVSYWDPAHHGDWISTLELALLAGCALWIGRRAISPWSRVALGVTVAATALAWTAVRVS